ncbi:hypothetical protein RJ641_034472 [Dillenia turbinata]|uniref:Uncharacterized protein n=1 Tax=Dillenia turbinata TaxID=194707 RepID=A0AAN8VVP1_9MAGN
MEEGKKKYSKKLDVVVRVVHLRCSLCQRVQENLISSSGDQVISKADDSPVTVADQSVQAVVSWVLAQSFGSDNVSIVAEEDLQTLSRPDSRLDMVLLVEMKNLRLPRFLRLSVDATQLVALKEDIGYLTLLMAH